MINFHALSGFVLVGGKSSRMKTDKAFLSVGGETFLERAVKTLETICEKRVKIVLNQTQKHFTERFRPNLPYVFDALENRGALGGIHAALKNCETKYAVILAVDLPLVSGEAIAKLAQTALSSNKFIAVVPRQIDGRLQPLCAVYRARYCLPFLESLMNKNHAASVNDFLELIQPRTITQNKLTTDETVDIFFNVNRPADFEMIKSEF